MSLVELTRVKPNKPVRFRQEGLIGALYGYPLTYGEGETAVWAKSCSNHNLGIEQWHSFHFFATEEGHNLFVTKRMYNFIPKKTKKKVLKKTYKLS